MVTPISENHPLRRLFAGLVEHALYSKLGMCEPDVACYLADLLTEFVHIDRVCALRNKRGTRLDEIAEMMTDAYFGPDLKSHDRDRLVHKHIGDYTLFWSGVYPESLQQLKSPARKDHMIDYYEQGKRSYAIASNLSDAKTDPPAEVFRRLSDNFEFCVYGLGLVRKGWEQMDPQALSTKRRLLS